MKTFLGLGSNIEDRYYNLQKGIKYLTEHPHIWIINKSYVYQSPPMYYFEQKDYYNMVLEIDTNLEPLDLLGILKDIEKKCGRKNNNNCKNMPRELDIDILAIDSLFIRSNILNIPHIAICDRKFVLKPWNDIAPDYLISNLNKTVAELLKETCDNSDLHMILELKGNS